MKSQQAAEREEQQRIKNLVLNYDLREDDQHDGIPNPSGFPSGPVIQPPLETNPNTKGLELGPGHYNPPLSRAEKAGRHASRARRLNLSDVDWYGTKKFRSNRPNGENENLNISHSSPKMTPRSSKKPG